MKKLCATLFAAMVLTALGLQGVATAAPAGATGWPTGCSNSKIAGGNGWLAKCSKSNGGHYKAVVICVPWGGEGSLITREAASWSSSGTSAVFCPPNSTVSSGGIMTKAS